MDKIEKIRQEIERRRLHFNKEAEKYQALNNGYSQNCYGARDALRDLENFLDTLSEEPDKSLEEAAAEYEERALEIIERNVSPYEEELNVPSPTYSDAFIAGAEWQKSQMMKDAYVESLIVEDGRIELEGDPLPCLNPIILLPYPQFKPGDKVRIIIVKED